MSYAQEALAKSEAVRQQALDFLGKLNNAAEHFELPKPPDALAEARRRLEDNTYKVLVVGEAKRGKSSFVNALIGRDVLPTDVDIATCEVFYVRHGTSDAARLRFEDDRTREIEFGKLSSYGSQVALDRRGVSPDGEDPRALSPGEVIRWIEVELPVSFLPPGVSILDTPGLGALYAAHAQITHRFVPLADAVVFVLDSNQPVTRPEIDFLKTLVSVTRNIFFIQTKIDRYDEEVWRARRQRNEEILQEHFGSELESVRVWPISSVNLRDAASAGSEAQMFVDVSFYPELEAALRAFLFRVAGWERAAGALLVGEHYHDATRQTLAGRWQAALEESRQKRNDLQQRHADRKRQFEADWGEHGKKRRELMENVRRVIAVAKQHFRTTLQPRGDIYDAQREEIDDITTPEEAQQKAEALTGEVIAEASNKWQLVCNEADARCAKLLGPFIAEADGVTALQETTLTGLVLRDKISLDLEDLWWKKMKGGRMEAMQAAGIAGVAGTAIVYLTGMFVTPILIGAVVAGIWGWFKGRRDAERRELENAKNRLRAHLNDILQKLWQHFFEVDISSMRFSRMDEFFEALEGEVGDRINAIVQQKSKEAAAELERFAEESRMDERQRRERALATKAQLDEWDGLGALKKQVMNELKTLDELLSRAAPAATA